MALRQIEGLRSRIRHILRMGDHDAKSKIARASLQSVFEALELERMKALAAELRRLKDWQARFERASALSPDRRHFWAKLAARYNSKRKELSKHLFRMVDERARGRQRRLSL